VGEKFIRLVRTRPLLASTHCCLLLTVPLNEP